MKRMAIPMIAAIMYHKEMYICSSLRLMMVMMMLREKATHRTMIMMSMGHSISWYSRVELYPNNRVTADAAMVILNSHSWNLAKPRLHSGVLHKRWAM